MSFEAAYAHLKNCGLADAVRQFTISSATVELAAQALGCEPARIAKTLAFLRGDGCVLVVAAGDARIDNAKFKAFFGCKASMLSPDRVLAETGHAVGGVCPFGIPAHIPVYLDASLKRFETVYPACGSGDSAVALSIPQLEQAAGTRQWIDVCKGWQTE
ncbi:MAG: YbaK/EbsC family protein [Clostridia bacterium]|nr:YbaK/EbsC family protein [Clostridia bacterium]